MDLAFDVQRSVWVELLMCLLPPSGAALVLREVLLAYRISTEKKTLSLSHYLVPVCDQFLKSMKRSHHLLFTAT